MIIEVPLELSARRLGKPDSFVTFLYTPLDKRMILSEHHRVRGQNEVQVLGSYDPATGINTERDKIKLLVEEIPQDRMECTRNHVLDYHFDKRRF
ncbi:MAG: hypothetical protein PHH00_02915 [Candidatus Nanoarchaeia archaeon]|nr:hypothetical protein [Candidatus Nanoarchaeia archaeon]